MDFLEHTVTRELIENTVILVNSTVFRTVKNVKQRQTALCVIRDIGGAIALNALPAALIVHQI